MGNICWDFPLLGTANINGKNNAAITLFRGSGIMDGLVREICQNSLDAHDDSLGSDKPVKVRFKLVKLKKSDFKALLDFGSVLQGAKSYWENSRNKTDDILKFIADAQATLDLEEIPMLVMSDYNTTGLNGMKASEGENNYWDILVNTEGISKKQNENSAGSFGIGKNAPFAYSGLSMVFYNTLAKDGGRGFEGVCHLVTTQRLYTADNTYRPTQSTGKYLNLIDPFTGNPIVPDDHELLAEIPEFNRSTFGTDVAIMGFKISEYPEWEKYTAIAAIKNFVLAIHLGKLVVDIESSTAFYHIDKDNVDKLLNNDFKNEEQLRYTRQIYETVTTVEPQKKRIAEDGDLTIFLNYKESYVGAVSRFRSTGMLINTTMESLPHYNVVIIVNDVGVKDLSLTLRAAEPPQHTEWKAKNITDNRTLHNKAQRYIRNIQKTIQDSLDAIESVSITSQMDAGIGDYLPANDGKTTSEETDALKTDIKINQIFSEGRIFYKRQYESAESAQGTDTGIGGTPAGKNKHKKRVKKRIKVVNPDDPREPDVGVKPGVGKVRISSIRNIKHRIFYMAANKYRFIVDVDKPIERAFIEFSAGRDDEELDKLVVKNVKAEGTPLAVVNGDKIGPVSLHEGSNTIYVEFDNHEIMALVPSFTMEEVISNEK